MGSMPQDPHWSCIYGTDALLLGHLVSGPPGHSLPHHSIHTAVREALVDTLPPGTNSCHC